MQLLLLGHRKPLHGPHELLVALLLHGLCTCIPIHRIKAHRIGQWHMRLLCCGGQRHGGLLGAHLCNQLLQQLQVGGFHRLLGDCCLLEQRGCQLCSEASWDL